MKLKLLKPELVVIVGDQNVSTGSVTSIKLIKKNNFIILETFGVYLETDFIVTGLTASYGALTDRVNIQWNPVSGITFYRVYKNKNQFLSELTGTTYTDTTQPPGVLSTYAVKTALFNQGITYNSKSVYADGWKKLTSPFLVVIPDSVNNEVYLEWNGISGATAYKLFKTQGTTLENLKVLGVTSSTIFIDKKVSFKNTYTYGVKASCILGDSELSNTESVILIGDVPVAPTNVIASTGEHYGKVVITWTPSDATQFYNVYRDNQSIKIGTNITQTTFEDLFPIPETQHQYYVSSENINGESTTKTPSSNLGWSRIGIPSNVNATDGAFTDKIVVSWDTVSGATGYHVYKGSPLIYYQAVNGISFQDFSVTVGQTYNYAVKSIGNLTQSDLSTSDTGFIVAVAPSQTPPEFAASGVSASDGVYTDKIQVTWNPVTSIQGVSGYKVYRISPNGSQSIQNSYGTIFDDTGATPGLTFEYKVLAYNLAGNGPLSTGNTGWMGLTAPTSLLASDGNYTDKVQLSWSSIHGPHVSYKIYKGSPLTQIGITSSTIFNDTAAIPGVVSQYAVTVFTSPQIESIFSNIDTGFVGVPAPIGLTASFGSFTDKIQVNWEDVPGAQAYRVYKNSVSNLVGTVYRVNLFQDTVTTPGITANYFVSSFIPDVLFESDKTGPVSGWRKLSPPTELTASKSEYPDKVQISWNSVVGATGYKVYRGISFISGEGVTLLGSTTTTTFFDNSPNQNSLYYAAKASCSLGDSEYSNIDSGYTNTIYGEIINYANEIQTRYKENIGNATYVASSPRLTKWSGSLYWNPINAKDFIEGVTAIVGKLSGYTSGVNIYDNFIQSAYFFGLYTGITANGLLGATYSVIEGKVQQYDPNSWWTDLNGTLGLTLRGGTANYYIRQRSLNELATKPRPGYAPDTTVWTNPRSKLLYNAAQISNEQYIDLSNLETICAGWRFMLPISNGVTADRSPTYRYKPHLNVRIQNQDYLNVIKTMLTEIKGHYPLALPANGLNKTNATIDTRTWVGSDLLSIGFIGRQYGGMSGGYRIPSPIVGATLDYDVWTGITYNTWSPDGITADQGEYIFDAWKRRSLVNSLYLLEGITTAVNPEGISGGQLLSSDSSWSSLFTDLRTLLWKEVRDHVKQIWERRPWYSVVNTNPGGRDDEFNEDIDNLGWIQGNQWLDPLCSVIRITMYLYPYAQTNIEKQALLAAYNMCSEHLAGLIERALYNCTDCNSAGVWMEGFGYAAQSFPALLDTLTDMKRMGDRRLWDTVTKRGTGVSYSCWANNAWKWMYTRVMPNCAIINSGSCDSSDYGGGLGNGYHWYGWPHEHKAILASENPTPGTARSALSVVYNRNKNISGASWFQGATNLFYELKKYHETVQNKPYRIFDKGNYFPDDQTFVWTSDFIIPDTQDERPGRGMNQTTFIAGNTNTSKPFIFGIWGKGACKFDGKAHRDEGHVSAYMGDAILLLELGEIRADDSNQRKFLEKESPGHNRMQLGGFRKYNWPRPAKITGIKLGETGGSLFMDLTDSYNTRSVTMASTPLYPWFPQAAGYYTNSRNGQLLPWGYGPSNEVLEYQYQISKVTRGISWAYEPYNRVSSYIKITDYVGLSGICGGVSGPTQRSYYRFHVGYTGATSGTDNGFILGSASPNNRIWTAGWTAPLGTNVISGGYTCDYLGVTMTFSADQPITITKTLVGNRASKEAHTIGNTQIFADQIKNYALDISLGLSGAAVYDEYKLNLTTEIQSVVFRNGSPIVIPTQKPAIRNYSKYTINSTTTLNQLGGCVGQFNSPTYVFPTWDIKISQYSGISFGKIMINDFLTLAVKAGSTLPNQFFTCPGEIGQGV